MEKDNPSEEDLIVKATDIAVLVDYQDGAVVIRTIIERTTGTVTLFAFDKGQGLSEHTAPYDALVYIIDGEALITISGRDITLKADEVTIMPANQPHALQQSTGSR